MAMQFWRRLRRRRFDADRNMDDEFRAHIEMEAAALAEAGVDPAEARRRAIVAFGGIERHKEDARDARVLAWADDALRDLRHVGRQIRRTPGFAVIIVLTLTLGLAANAAVFSVVNGVLLQPLPYADPDRLLIVRSHGYKGELLQLQERARTVVVSGIELSRPVTMTGRGEPARLQAAGVLPDFFALLGVQPAIGRPFGPHDVSGDAERVVLLSHRLWTEAFGADPSIPGQDVTIDGTRHRIAGVMPAGAGYPPQGADLWLPLAIDPDAQVPLWSTTLQIVARLRPGSDLAAARAELSALWPTFRGLFPWKMPETYGSEVDVVPMHEHLVGDVRTPLLVLLGGVIAVLLIVCANVANLMLVRAAARSRELTVRAAIGAGRGRLVRQIVTESLAFSLVGAGAGLLLAAAIAAALQSRLGTVLPRAETVRVDGWVILVTAGAAICSALMAALHPAVRAWGSTPLVDSSTRGATTGREQRATARTLAAAQVAIAAVLVTIASLLVVSVSRLLSVDPGFTADGLVIASIAPPEHRYTTAGGRRAFLDGVLERSRAIPGVSLAAAGSSIPFGGHHGSVFTIRGRPDPASQSGEWPWADVRTVITRDYLPALRVPVVAGRNFTDDDREGTTPVAIVSAALARQYWPEGDAIGARIAFPGTNQWLTIIGIAGDVRWTDLAADSESALYLPASQSPMRAFTIVLRAGPDAGAAAASRIRQVVAALDRDTPVSSVRYAADIVEASAARPRLLASMLTFFAGTALLLGAVGVYGVLSYAVTRRTQELGVRMALGASRRDVLLLVLRQGIVLASAGAVAGAIAAAVLSRSIAGLLFGVDPSEPVILIGGPALMIAVALAASSIPALRAARVDPVTALRLEG